MRNLTIKRHKSFIACMKKVKVYIEDYSCQDIIIKDVPCRKLGDLKNNEEKTFMIGDHEAKVFVISDKLTKGYCNDFYTIPAGVEDVYLTGKNTSNILHDGAFLFDGVTEEASLKNRKKNKRFIAVILMLSMIVGGVIGFFGDYFVSKGDPKTFALEEMRITLTDKFVETESSDSDFTLETDAVLVCVEKEERSLLEDYGELTLEEYGNLVIESNGLSGISELYQNGGLYYYEYAYDEMIDTYYLCFVYESEDAFWIVTFAMAEFNWYNYSDYLFEWASSVEFTE